MNTKFKKGLAAAGLTVIGFSVIPGGIALASGNGTDNIDICHSTSADSNPYTTNHLDPDSVFINGHTGHVGPLWSPGATTWGDIIPPFDYSGGHYDGLNWTAEGQIIWANNCNLPKVEPSPTVSPTVSPTASPTVSPTASPTASPTVSPTASPTASPTVSPTVSPTASPTTSPTASPTASPTVSPTASPTVSPTAPVVVPTTQAPTIVPTIAPSPAPDAPDVLPHTGTNTELLLTWSILGIGIGTVMTIAGLRKPA